MKTLGICHHRHISAQSDEFNTMEEKYDKSLDLRDLEVEQGVRRSVM